MRYYIGIILIFVLNTTFAQIKVPDKAKFAAHLVNLEYYNDAIYYINSNLNENFSFPFRDSLNFLKGWSHYSIKELEQSANSLLQVSANSPYFHKSRFFAAYNNSHVGNLSLSNQVLSNLLQVEKYKGLQSFELAGNALLNRDIPLFESHLQKLGTSTDFAFSNEKQKLQDFSISIKSHKDKSPVVAGLLSAIIPGSGKIYAGKTGEGIASFIIVGAAGFTALENYNKLGAKHAKSVIFSSLFSILYIGNIYGTVFTVKLVNEEFHHEMDHKILFNMHIPLRNIFN